MRADFYLIAKPRFLDDPLRLVCELARKCYAADKATLILARDADQAETVDDRLWTFDEQAYLPHQIAGVDEDDDATPILIVPPGVDTPGRPYVVNLRDTAFAGACERVLEVVPADPAAREPLRARWRAYQQRGFTLSKHDM